MKILVIINPVAGSGKALRRLTGVKRWLSQSSHDFIYEISSTSDEMRSKIRGAPARGIDAIILSGGDGTVHQALPAIAETGLPFGYLPCGRGNDFARNIGLPPDLKSNCAFLSTPSFHRFDLPSINQKTPFVAVAYVGFDGEVNRLANAHKGYFGGTLGYIICVLKALKNFKPFEVEITIDGHTLRERVMMVSVANAPFYGGGMKIAPQAIMDDGVLDICIVKEISKFELLRQFPKVFKGTHVTHPRIMMAAGRTIKIVSNEERDLFADGEHAGKLPVECTVNNRTIRVLAPSNTNTLDSLK
ncbi:MAG: diacylglycerol kinase family lipid kinase [Deltaproteobacteria bacterium]|nr:diacylglycerol kinase family lipid kinase [Deltaproteobacteria bacterium]